MKNETSKGQTVKLHRVIKASPEKVYRAFTDGAALCKWLPPYGFTGTIEHLDARPGGTFKMSFTNFTTQKGQSFGGTYNELKPNEKISYSDKFDDPNLPGEMTTTILLKKVMPGTEIHIEQSGIPEAIPAEMCYLGWQESLEQLIKLVEPDIQM